MMRTVQLLLAFGDKYLVSDGSSRSIAFIKFVLLSNEIQLILESWIKLIFLALEDTNHTIIGLLLINYWFLYRQLHKWSLWFHRISSLVPNFQKPQLVV